MALWAVVLVFYSTYYTGMTITRVTSMRTHVTALEPHYASQIAATISSTIEIIRVLQESLSLGLALALDRQPRQDSASITLHQPKELGP